MVIPGHLIFIYAIGLVQTGHSSATMAFLVVYLLAALLQVFLLLYSAHIMILWMWRRKIDPDNSSVSFLSVRKNILSLIFTSTAPNTYCFR